MGYAFVNSLSGTVCTLAFGSVLYILGCKVGSVIVSGTLILALTSLLAKEGFFLFAIIGLSGKHWAKSVSLEIMCQFLWTASLIVWLLSLNFNGVTSG